MMPLRFQDHQQTNNRGCTTTEKECCWESQCLHLRNHKKINKVSLKILTQIHIYMHKSSNPNNNQETCCVVLATSRVQRSCRWQAVSRNWWQCQTVRRWDVGLNPLHLWLQLSQQMLVFHLLKVWLHHLRKTYMFISLYKPTNKIELPGPGFSDKNGWNLQLCPFRLVGGFPAFYFTC